MNAALWGLAAALSFGLADFCGRFTGRALGPASATLGLMLVGAVLLSLHAAGHGLALPAAGPDLWALLLTGIAASVAPLAFYRAMTLAPLSLVMPIAAAYPALVVPVGLMTGAAPAPGEWLGMAVTLAGALVVARTAEADPDAEVAADPANRRRAILYALAAAGLFAVTLLAGERAVAAYGEVATLWIGRMLGVAILAIGFAVSRRAPCLPRRWWPVLAVQGLLDGAAYFFYFMGARGDDAPVAAVASSAFMVVGVLLGWAVLKERLTPACWSGVALVFAGVALLSWLGAG